MTSSVAETFIQILPHLPEQTLKDLRHLLSEDLIGSDTVIYGEIPSGRKAEPEERMAARDQR